MQFRDKKLLFAALGLVGFVLLIIVAVRLTSAFSTRRQTVGRLKGEIASQQLRLKQSAAALARRNEYETRSLPRDVTAARARYQDWLFKKIADAGFKPPHDVTAKPVDPRGDLRRLPFDVKVRGTLDQLVRLLYGFYHAGHLHQIRRLAVTRVEKSRELELDLGIEALSLPEASRQGDLSAVAGGSLAKPDLAAYLTAIHTRNVVGPPNRPPVLSRISPVTGKVGQSVSFTASASDPDPFDQVQYKLDGEKPPGAAIDEKSGRFTWSPPIEQKPGEYTVNVVATDTGAPPRSVTQSVKITLAPPALKLATLSDRTIECNRVLEFPVRLAEQVPMTKVTYEFEGEVTSATTLDAATGQFKFAPTADMEGQTLTVTIRARDDAKPPHTDRQSFSIKVGPPKAIELALDVHARNTYLTAIVDNGQTEVWFFARTLGQTIKLPHPEVAQDERFAFRVGSFQGRVVDIRRGQVVVESQNQRVIIPLGASLADYVPAP
jgi:hypothetical protein